MKKLVSRRDFLKAAGISAAAGALAACQPKTVIVKETVEVEKVVKETVEVTAAVPVEFEEFDLVHWARDISIARTRNSNPTRTS